jgi:hypothetical protein
MNGSRKECRIMRSLSWGYGAQAVLFAATAALLLSATPACTGTLGDPYGSGDGGSGNGSSGTTGGETDAKIASHSQFPRLSHAQWERTVADLFYLDTQTGLSASFTPDPLGSKAFDNNESALDVTPGLWADYQRAAEEIALLVSSDPALLDKILPASLPADLPAKKTAFLTAFGKRAYRRPLLAAELDQLSALFDQGPTFDPAADPFVAGVRLTLEAILQSPFFVYRPELSTFARPDGQIPLSGYEVATRLSYALWGTMPDESLFAAAEAGKLTSLDGVEAEARRMLDEDRARATLLSFHDQLYDADQYVGIDKSTQVYPDFDPAIGEDMRKELSLFVEDVLIKQKGGLSQLLTSRTTFVNARLAKIYGLDATGMDNDTFVQAELPEAERSGLLTRAGFLAWKGTKTQPDSILRGVFINRRILCQDLGDPPPEAMGAMLGAQKTNREKVSALTGKGTCGEGCHAIFINPAGFALEHFGALGEYRTEDNGELINAADTYPFQDGAKSYDGAGEFSKAVAEAEQSHLCYSRYWLEYLYGRDKKTEDATLLTELAGMSKKGASVQDLVVALVTSDTFLTRSPVEVKP